MHIQPSFVLVLAFLQGAIPYGWIIAKLWGVADLRKVGSSNVGATNVVRAAGWLPGALTFLMDFLKGLLPMMFLHCEGNLCSGSNIWVGVAAVLGHCYSPFLSFKGGKGVSTTLGVAVALNPWLGGVSIFVYLVVLGIVRISALGSLFAMLTLLVGELLFGASYRDQLAVALLAIVVLQRHRSNWEDLLKARQVMIFAVSFGGVMYLLNSCGYYI